MKLNRKVTYDKRNYNRRERVLDHYGRECAFCGETDKDVLVIDHIEGNGNMHRRQIGTSNIYWWLISNHFPIGYRVLCFNCNNKAKKFARVFFRPMDKRDYNHWKGVSIQDFKFNSTLECWERVCS